METSDQVDHGADTAALARSRDDGTNGNDDGWLEVEQTLTAMELPPVPPTSDPQRLLSYVVNILPKYTEMEMLATHLRLYAVSLEQEMEQVRGHVRVLGREVDGEREKKQFLERYAAQVVKERNDLLHARGAKSAKPKSGAASSASASSHYAWHACCKKNTAHAMDLTPSIAAFRGEKLQDAMHQIRNLQDEIRNQEMLRREMDFLLKKAQREHDSKQAADRKSVQQLEKQLLQRSMLHSNLERKLYEVESALAKHDQVKDEEMEALATKMQATNERVVSLESENATLFGRVQELVDECDQLSKKLSVVTEAKNALADKLDQTSEQHMAAEAEIEALRSEIDLLQTTDVRNVRAEYATRIQKLQQESAATEQNLRLEIDRLRQELKKSSEAMLSRDPQRSQLPEGIATATAFGSPSTRNEQTDEVAGTPLPSELEWRSRGASGSISQEDDEYGVGSSLSRSQLSESSSSVSKPASIRSGVTRRLFTASQSYHDDTRRSRTSNSAALIAKESELQDKDRDVDDRDADDANNSSSSSFFNWESFIDSPSECESPDPKRAKRMSQLDENLELYHADASLVEHDLRATTQELQRLDVSSSSAASHEVRIRHESATELSCVESEQASCGTVSISPPDVVAVGYDDVPDQEYYSEEEKDEEKQPQRDLAQELREMLSNFERKRIEEEQKATQVEQALQEFQKTQQRNALDG